MDAQSFCQLGYTFPSPFSGQSGSHKAIARPANASTAPAKDPKPPEAAPVKEEVVDEVPGT